jgi:hypothetical protein
VQQQLCLPKQAVLAALLVQQALVPASLQEQRLT